MEIFPRARTIGVTINKHSRTIPMDTDQPVEQHTSILKGIESRNTDHIPTSPIFTEEYLPVVEKEEDKPNPKQRRVRRKK